MKSRSIDLATQRLQHHESLVTIGARAARRGLGALPMVFSTLHPSTSSYNSAGPKAYTDSW